jgi:hypothetical protein
MTREYEFQTYSGHETYEDTSTRQSQYETYYEQEARARRQQQQQQQYQYQYYQQRGARENDQSQGSINFNDFIRWYRQHFEDIFREFEQMAEENSSVKVQRRVYRYRTQNGERIVEYWIERNTNSFPRGHRRRGIQHDGYGRYFNKRDQMAKWSMNPLGAFIDFLGRIFGQSEEERTERSIEEFPRNFSVVEKKHTTSDGFSFHLVTEHGASMGELTERYINPEKGSILMWMYKDELLAKARQFTTVEGIEKTIIENANSQRIAKTERVFGLSVTEWIGDVLKPKYIVRGETDNEILGYYLLSRNPLQPAVWYYNSQNELIAETRRESLTSGNDHWTTVIHVPGVFPPAVFIFIPAFKSIANQRRASLSPFGSGGLVARALNFFSKNR